MKKNAASVERSNRLRWQRTVLSQAVAVVTAGMQASMAMAACPATAVPPNETATCQVNGGDTATINSGGSIIVAAGPAIQLNGNGDKTINNSGTLTGSQTAIQDQFGATGTVTINNNAGGAINATSTGIWINPSNTSVAITNAGTITASNSSDSFAAGIYFSGDMNGSITNSGTINATITDGVFASAYGIYISGDQNGTITNSGTISVSVTAAANSSESAYAAGIYVNGGVVQGASITNSGTITVAATSALGDVTASGIFVGFGTSEGVTSFSLAGTITNSGTITVTASAPDNDAEAYGIVVDGVVSGTLTNASTGNISATASGTSATAAGIVAASGIAASGSVTNNGTIGVTATASDGEVRAAGIYVAANVDGSVTNAGTINVTATANAPTSSAFASAVGVYVSDGVTGTVTNSGTINVTATSDSPGFDGAEGYGIYVSSTVTSTGAVTNSGTINVTLTGEFAGGAGLYVSDALDGSLTNSGTINVTGHGLSSVTIGGITVYSMGTEATLTNSGTINVSGDVTSGGASAGGITVRSSIYGTLTNSGTINVTASNSGEGYAAALGMYLNRVEDGGSVTNSASGVINATGTGGSSQYVFGIFIQSALAGSTVTNAGTINAFSDNAGNFGDESGSGAAGLYIRYLEGGATVTNSGTINADTADGAGLGWAMVVRFSGTSEGSAPTIVNSGHLNGNVYIGGDASLNNSGTLSIPVIGEGYAPVGSYIGGNYTQLSGGVLEVGAHSVTEYGQLEVAGTADFTASGHLAVKVTPADQLYNGGVLDNVVHAGTLVDNNGADLFVTDNSAMWNFSAIDDGENGIDLTVLQGLSLPQSVIQNGPKWALPAATAMQTVIDGGEATGDMAQVVAELGALGTSQELSAASAQFVPVIAGQSSQQANLAMDELSSVVMARLDAFRATGVEGSHDKNLWTRPFFTSGKQDSDKGFPGYDFHSAGLVIGYDTNVGNNVNVGGALAYSEPQVNSDTPWFDHSINVDAYQGSLYGYWDAGNATFVDVLLIGGYNDNHANRRIRFGGIDEIATGNYDGYYGRASVAAGHGFKIGDHAEFVPSMNLAYTYISEDSYTETGAGALDLKVDDNDADSLVVGLDAAFTYTAEKTIMSIHVGGGYDTLTDEVSLTSAFVGGGPAFKTTGPEPEKWLVRAGAGFEVAATEQLDLHFNYEYEYRDTFSNNLLAATLRFKL